MNRFFGQAVFLPCLVAILALTVGCHGLTPGKMEWVQTDSDAQRAGNVFQETQTGPLSRTIIERYRNAANPEPLVLIGHSYGADNVVRAARALEPEGITVDLMVTLDATTPPRVPGNVKLAYNYYQPQATDFIPLFRGIALRQDEGATGKLININLRDDGKELLTPGTNHINIDKNDRVHEAVIQNVLSVCPPRDQWLARGGRGSNNASPTGGGR
jgi:pimeloyl-ACP methyl ester carboxylesterase